MSIAFSDIRKLYVPYNGVSTEIKRILRDGVVIWQTGFTFKYSGSATLNGTAITPNQEYNIDTDTDFLIKFLTSGTLTIGNAGLGSTFDAFCAGGGGATTKYNNGEEGYIYRQNGGGAGGGYTTTQSSFSLSETDYSVVIGAGAVFSSSGTQSRGGTSSFANASAAGGYSVVETCNGGSGGSGGAASDPTRFNWCGADDGANGVNSPNWTGERGGTGQGTTTREFGEASGTLYCSGGASGPEGWASSGGGCAANQSGGTNTGNGAGSGEQNGGSGIVCLRNHRS